MKEKPYLLYSAYQGAIYDHNVLRNQDLNDLAEYEPAYEWLKKEYRCKLVSPLNGLWTLEFENGQDRLLFILKFGG